ncbi:MAG: AsnC family transcriptional regulator, partial [DPANN group archaeon]|nr:AsnC family transcriptional regulator [DPANN group archaeon]
MRVRLDLKDRKLIYELDIDSRQSASRLAKKVGISKQGCTYKIRKLFEKGILTSTLAILNTPLMGHLSFRMYFKLIDISPEKEELFRHWLTEHRLIPWLVGCEGIWDYIIVVFPTNFAEFQQFSQELNNDWGDYIERKDIALVTEAHHFRAGYLLGKKTDLQPLTYGGQPQEIYKLDEIDNNILSLLSADARIGLVEMGKKLKMPAKSVSYRVKKLEDAGM